MFESNPSEGTWKEIFEQLVAYTLSPDFDEMNVLVESLVETKEEVSDR